MTQVFKNMKLCVAIFFMMFMVHVAAMEKNVTAMENNVNIAEMLSPNTLENASKFSEIEEWFKLAKTNKYLYDTIMNEDPNFSKRMNFYKDIDSFMKEYHGGNWTCETSYENDKQKYHYPIYVCQSTLTPNIEFQGHPGFELETIYNYDVSPYKIVGDIEGQGKAHHINHMMRVEKIDRYYPKKYISLKNVTAEILPNYWETYGITYTLNFIYEDINGEMKQLFHKNNEVLGLCNIAIDRYDGFTGNFQYDSQKDTVLESPNYKSHTDKEAMRYTFDFSKSKYYQQNQK